jgi:hypothetical protein
MSSWCCWAARWWESPWHPDENLQSDFPAGGADCGEILYWPPGTLFGTLVDQHHLGYFRCDGGLESDDLYLLSFHESLPESLLRKEGSAMKLGDIALALRKKKPNVINLLNNLVDQGIMPLIL